MTPSDRPSHLASWPDPASGAERKGRPRSTGRSSTGWVVLVVAGVSAVIATAVALIALVVTTVGGGRTTAYVDLAAGDCFDLPDLTADAAGDGYFDTVELIDCGEAHEVEVMLVGVLDPDGDRQFPGDEAAGREADARCAAVSPASDADPADVAIVAVAPAEPTWESFEGHFVCLALRVGGAPLVGSLTPPGSADG